MVEEAMSNIDYEWIWDITKSRQFKIIKESYNLSESEADLLVDAIISDENLFNYFLGDVATNRYTRQDGIRNKKIATYNISYDEYKLTDEYKQRLEEKMREYKISFRTACNQDFPKISGPTGVIVQIRKDLKRNLNDIQKIHSSDKRIASADMETSMVLLELQTYF
jgi:hypothetical protein